MRAWGLAKGLLINGVEVDVAINESFPQELSVHEGIKLLNWSTNDDFIELINRYDAVLMSYCMGSDSVFIAENINDSALLILDVYVPIYVEVSARNAGDMPTELSHYLDDIQRFNHVLKRGDYFICANQTQKVFYTGILGSLGVVNPRSYAQDRILIVPFGIHNEPVTTNKNPYLPLGIKKTDKIILWFGGLYPWFRVEDYLKAILNLSKLHKNMRFVFVGGKNPFNDNPDLRRQYDKALAFADQHRLRDKIIFFVDWVDFDTRANWYTHADFIVSLNQPGEENGFSWRTRVMDYVWGEVVTLTNGGDPLGEQLLAANAAIELTSLQPEEITRAINYIYEKPDLLKLTKERLIALKEQFYWDNITHKLSEKIKTGFLPFNDEQQFRKDHSIVTIAVNSSLPPVPQSTSRVRKLAKAPFKLYTHARQKGLKRTAKLAGSIVRTQMKRRSIQSSKQFVFISHPIDNTGAPLVLLQIIDEVRQKYGSKNMRVLAPTVIDNHKPDLARKGIKIQKAAHMNLRLTGLQLGLKKHDFVLMNTVAIYENYRNYILNLLSANRLAHAFWFIHEDIEQLKVVMPALMVPEYVNKIRQLANEGKLTLLVPSEKVRHAYNELFGIESVVTIPLHVSVPHTLTQPRPASDYKKLNFMLSGTPSDGRKGQLIALAAFQRFVDIYQQKKPAAYRDFSLHLVSIGDDYISSQIKSIGNAVLGKKLHTYPTLPRNEALNITHQTNAVICCSLNETFALYVAEGMAMGQVVLRNNTAGIDEQLKEGVNGCYIDSENINQFAKVLEKLLNKKTSTDTQLMKMGKESQKMMTDYSKNSYLDVIEKNYVTNNES